MKRILLSVLCYFMILSSAEAEDVQGLLDVGDVVAASAQFERDAASENGNVSAQALTGLAQIALSEGRVEDAANYASRLAQKLEDAEFVSMLENGRKSGWFVISQWLNARVSTASGNDREAQGYLKKAESLLGSAKVSEAWRAVIYVDYSHAIASDEKRARKYVEEAIEIYDAVSDVHSKGHAELWLGDLELGRGKERRAISHYDSAIRNLKKSGNATCVFEARLHAAEKLSEAGETRAAQAHVSTLMADYAAAGSPADYAERVTALTGAKE